MKTKRRQIPKKNRELIINRDGRKCFYCGSTERLTVDHIIPLKHGGSNLASNMITSCHSCNSTKNGNRLLPKFETVSLNRAYMANVEHGISQDMDITYTRREPSSRRRAEKLSDKEIKRRQRVRARRRGEQKRIETIKDRVSDASKKYSQLYITETKDACETKRLIDRMRRRGKTYLSIPRDDNGGKVFLLSAFDKKSASKKTSPTNAIEIFTGFVANKNGYLSGCL